jgi:DNA-binding FrmR family transcriptional regulator
MAQWAKTVAKEKGSLAAHPEVKHEAVSLMRTVIGHVQGIERMIEEERYCIDILKQIAAVQGLLTKLAQGLSESHMKHCVKLAIEEGRGEEKIDELMEVFKYLRGV